MAQAANVALNLAPVAINPATDFYFVESPSPAGPIVTGVRCSLCPEEFSDLRIGKYVTSSCVDQAIAHSKQSHQAPRIIFRLRKTQKPRLLHVHRRRFL
jgi:hypothetical protein